MWFIIILSGALPSVSFFSTLKGIDILIGNLDSKKRQIKASDSDKFAMWTLKSLKVKEKRPDIS